MKKIMIIAAIAALTLASCAKVETVSNPEMDAPVTFGAYAGKTVTKTGLPDETTDATLASNGFGVFAYQTVGDYSSDSGTGSLPNFMYNQKVSKPSSAWEYTPIKYWPNQIAADDTDGQTDPAHAYATHKVTFFAYAPYVKIKTTGALLDADDDSTTFNETDDSYGITAITSNEQHGDPKVSYKIPKDGDNKADLDKQVDLVWGVVNPAADQAWTPVAGDAITLDKGRPFYDLQKPNLTQTIHFYFRHALAQLKLQAITALDVRNQGASTVEGEKEAVTVITIDKVVMTIEDMPYEGVLNLNNTTANEPNWTIDDTSEDDMILEVVNANINPNMQDKGDVNADEQASDGNRAGVIWKNPASFTTPGFDADVDVMKENKYFTILPKDPGSGNTITVNVKVTYYVTTDDENLKGGHSRVENVISHDVEFDKFEGGKKYMIRMILGLTDVKFEAEVVDWIDGDAPYVDLPANTPAA